VIRVTDNHAARLLRLARSRVLPALGEELTHAAQTIVDTMRHEMNDGAISGPGHIPGPPYGTAKSDTHQMEESLHVTPLIETPGEIRTGAAADTPYALYVELGTSRALPRPGLQLATAEHRTDVREALGKRFIEEVNS
jgi:hypothetical protein